MATGPQLEVLEDSGKMESRNARDWHRTRTLPRGVSTSVITCMSASMRCAWLREEMDGWLVVVQSGIKMVVAVQQMDLI